MLWFRKHWCQCRAGGPFHGPMAPGRALARLLARTVRELGASVWPSVSPAELPANLVNRESETYREGILGNEAVSKLTYEKAPLSTVILAVMHPL